MILPILKHKAPQLRQVAVPFDWKNVDHVSGLQSLMDTFNDSPRALGLAATQLGLMFRAFVMRRKRHGVITVVNPIIISESDWTEEDIEECLSLPNLKVRVRRTVAASVMWEREEGQYQTAQIIGDDVRCFMHELDHLNGITIQQRRIRE